MSLNRIIIIGLITIGYSINTSAQSLKVIQSNDNRKVARNSRDSIATIIIDSYVKDLTVDNDMCDEKIVIAQKNRTQHIINVDIQKDRQNQIDNSTRSLLLNSPKSAEYILETEELFPRQLYYYTVILPNQFSTMLTIEYIFTRTSRNALRLSIGKHLGGYISYKWGEYKKAGVCIEDVTSDYDVTRAIEMGYIRSSIVGGFRIGLMQKDLMRIPIGSFLLIGGGYGEYGRQWINPTLVGNSQYFNSDYIKGFNGEVALQLSSDWLSASFGAELIVNNGKITVDYMLGLGISLNFDKIIRLGLKK